MLDRRERSILEPLAWSSRHSTMLAQTLRKPILRTDTQNSAISEADAYRPCGISSTTNRLPFDASLMNNRSPLAVKPLHRYQLKSENLINSKGFNCNNASIATSSSLPRMSKTALLSAKGLCKNSSNELKQNLQIASSDDAVKSKCESKILSSSSRQKFSHGNNLDSWASATTCIAEPIYCDNETTRDSRDTLSPSRKPTTVRRTSEKCTNLPVSSPSKNIADVLPASGEVKNSAVDIKWDEAKHDNTGESKYDAIGSSTKPVMKVIRPRRLTVAFSTMNDWPNAENTTSERNPATQKNAAKSDSLRRKVARESPRKPWFSSSVDGPPVTTQIRETAIDDDLPCNRLVAPLFSSTTRSASVTIQKSTAVRSGSSQSFRMAATPPPKPTRTYEELLTDLIQTEKPELNSKSKIECAQKICPVIVPKDYRNSRDHSSDSGLGADFRKSSSDTTENCQNVQMSGKWLQSLDLPCESCYLADDEESILLENPLIRWFLFSDKLFCFHFIQLIFCFCRRRNSLVVRTQTGLRVKTIIGEKKIALFTFPTLIAFECFAIFENTTNF